MTVQRLLDARVRHTLRICTPSCDTRRLNQSVGSGTVSTSTDTFRYQLCSAWGAFMLASAINNYMYVQPDSQCHKEREMESLVSTVCTSVNSKNSWKIVLQTDIFVTLISESPPCKRCHTLCEWWLWSIAKVSASRNHSAFVTSS